MVGCEGGVKTIVTVAAALFLTGLGTSSPASFFSLQRKNKVAGNPCPICRDHKLHVDFRVRRIFSLG